MAINKDVKEEAMAVYHLSYGMNNPNRTRNGESIAKITEALAKKFSLKWIHFHKIAMVG